MHSYNCRYLFLVLAVALVVACTPLERAQTRALGQVIQQHTFFPIVAVTGCAFGQEAHQFYTLLVTDEAQRHPRLSCNSALNAAALNRAYSMAINKYFAHCDLGGICANDYARAAGCKLPSDYGSGNNIESLLAGTGDALTAYSALMASPSHRAHLLGADEFFMAQDQLGIAFLSQPGSPYTFYWVILIGQCL